MLANFVTSGVASQPINDGGQSPGAKTYANFFHVGTLHTKFSVPPLMAAEGQLLHRKSKYVGLLLGQGSETDIYDCIGLVMGQAW